MSEKEIIEIIADDQMLEVMMIATAYDGLDYIDCFPN